MIQIVLFEPEIPPNTGNIIRLCANTGAHLHLVEPLGFSVDDAKLRRAGLDYHEFANIRRHSTLEECISTLGTTRLFAFSTRGKHRYDHVRYQNNDTLLFGPESRGLPASVLNAVPDEHKLFLPMQPGQRSLNLSNAVAIAAYEVWRQGNFYSLS